MDLSQLRIVSLKNLIPHELADFRRIEFLSKKISQDGCLKNPVVAGRFGDANKLLVLDGSTRASALKILGFPDALVQVVDFQSREVELETWGHLILGTNREEVLEETKRLGLNVTSGRKDEAISILNDRRVISCFVFGDENSLIVSNCSSDVESQIRELKRLLAVCYKKQRICCTDYEECLNLAKQNTDRSVVVHLLPGFLKEEILAMALRAILLPIGVTRFVVPQRILRVDISNDVLASNVSLEEKNLFLSELIRYRMENKKIRFYQESVLFLNE